MMKRRFRRLFRHTSDRPDLAARELDDEIQAHLAQRAEQLERLGMTPDEARAEALRRFGDASAMHEFSQTAKRRAERTRAHEQFHELRAAFIGLRQDIRFGLRALRAQPTFAAATVATLALAIAAAVTAFSFVDTMFLRPLPAPSSERLVRVYLPHDRRRFQPLGDSGAALLRSRSDVFERVAAERCCWVKFVRERGSLDQRFVALASAEFFPMVGVAPALGRFFVAAETAERGSEPVAVLSYSLWQRTFGGEPRVLGEHIRIGRRDFTIIGVAPPGFVGVSVGNSPSDIWVPPTMSGDIGLGCQPAIPCDNVDVLARLAPGVGEKRAEAAIANLGSALSHVSIGDDSVRRPIVLRASGALVELQQHYSPLSRLLGTIAAVLLVIACANLSGLLTVRGVSRAREIALRRSLGASRLRIVQQLVVESTILGIAGGIAGLVLSIAATRQLMSFFIINSEGFETFLTGGIDSRILWFSLGVSLIATLLFGVVPALLATRAQPADLLKSGTPGSGHAHARFELIVVQVALTSALLSGAALLSMSFNRLLHAQRFDAEHVALFRVRPAAAQYDSIRAERYVRAIAERVASLPGVEDVAFARGSGFVWSGSPVDVQVGMSAGDSTRRTEAHFVSPHFFRALHIRVEEGREFNDADRAGTPLVAIVSESLVRTLSPSSSVVGRTLYAHGKAFRVVGVVPDYRVRVHDAAVPAMVFFPFWQNALGPEDDARFAVRVHGDPAAALRTLRVATESVDPGVPVAEVMTLSHQMDATFPEIHLGETVLWATGGLALLLSAIGLYGMIAFLVARRTKDIGIRIALGALPSAVASRFVMRGLSAAGAGLAIGLAGSWMLGHLLNSWLVGVQAHDVTAFAIAAVGVLVAATLACAVPARRAAGIDPAITLRAE